MPKSKMKIIAFNYPIIASLWELSVAILWYPFFSNLPISLVQGRVSNVSVGEYASTLITSFIMVSSDKAVTLEAV